MNQTNPSTNLINNQGGQLMVEAILLLAIAVGASIMITHYFEEKKFTQNLVAKPWGTLTGMIECGVWTGCKKGAHPNTTSRTLSLDPK